MSSFDPFERVRRLRRSAEQRGAGEAAGRVPPGQTLTRKFPVLTYGATPSVSTRDWRLRIHGLVEEEIELDWQAFRALPSRTQTVDIHCVTRWSKLDTVWTGVPFTEVLRLVTPLPEADHVMIHCHGGYTTNMRLDEMLEAEVMVAYEYEGQPLEAKHGGPARLLVPKLYLWKSAKWVQSFELMLGNRPGFWERHGYNMHGDPWAEERFS